MKWVFFFQRGNATILGCKLNPVCCMTRLRSTCLLNNARDSVRVRRSRIFPQGSSPVTFQGSCTHRWHEAVQCLHECQSHFGRMAIWRCNNYFKFLDYKKTLKIGMSSVGKMPVVCAILRNALNCLYGNQTAEYFHKSHPLWRDTLFKSVSCFHHPLF